jgi:HEAT repeat protein
LERDDTLRISMLSPAEITRQKRVRLDAADAEAARETAIRFVDQLVTERVFTEVLRSAVADLAEAYPDVVTDVLPRLDDDIVDGLSEPDRCYRRSSVHLALELARIDPDSAPLLADSLREAIALELDEWRIERMLITVAGSNPAFLADNLDLLVETVYDHETVRTNRAWALARAYRLDPTAFDDAVAERRSVLTGDADAERRISALDTLGKLGIAVPEAAAPAVPDIVPFATADDERLRREALDALGWIGGAEWQGGEWFGRFADLDAEAYEAFEAGVEAEHPEVATTAGEAYARAVADDERRRDRAVSCLLDRLATEDDDDVTEPIAIALVRLTDGVDITESGAARTLLDFEASTGDGYGRAAALRLLGRIDPSIGDRASIERALVGAMGADSTTVCRGAIDGAVGVLTRQTDPAPTLVAGLVEATVTGESARQTAFGALGDTSGSDAAIAGLCAGLDDPNYSDRVAKVACELGAEAVVDALVSRLVTAFDDADPERSADDSDDYLYGNHLDDEPAALLDALNEVVAQAPELLVPHADDLSRLFVDPSIPDGHALVTAVDAIAVRAPERIEPFVDGLERRLADAQPVDVGYLLDALLAVGAPDDRTLERVVDDAEPDVLGVAVGRLGDRNPLYCLRLLSTLKSQLRFASDHIFVKRWIHELGDMGDGDVRVAPTALDLCHLALTSVDDWVRWDGAEALAHVAETHPERVETERPALRAALDDSNRHVPRWALSALEHVGEASDRSLVDPFTVHPYPMVREAAGDTLDGLDATSTTGGRDTAAGRPWRYVSGGGPVPEAVDGDDRLLATVVVALRHPSDAVRERARDALIDDADGDDVADTLARLLDDDDPMTRALAADAVGRIDPEDTEVDRVVDALTARLDDQEPVVRRWAARSIGRVGAAGVEVPTAELSVRLHDDDPVTRAYVLRALRRLADADPGRLHEVVDPVVHALDDADEAVRATAATTLVTAPPDAVASVPNVTALVVDRFDDSMVENRTAAALVAVVATGDPTALRPHLDTLTDKLGFASVRYAVARLAADDPAAVRPFEERLLDANDDTHVRRALARMHSTAYPDSLRDELAWNPETLREELDTVVEYVITEPNRESRREALDAVVDMVGWQSRSFMALFERLVDALAAETPGVRKNAAGAIGYVVSELDDGTEDVVGAALPALLDRVAGDDWEVRSQSLRAVEAIVGASWAPVDDADRLADVAVRALGDEHGRARRRAARILGSLPEDGPTADAYDRVVAVLRGDGPLATRGGTLAIGHVAPLDDRHVEGLEVLSGRFDDDDPWIRRNAVESARLIAEASADTDGLLESASSPVREAVRGRLSDRNPVVRAESYRCLGVIGTAADEDALVAGTDDGNALVREGATTALERLRKRIGVV